MVFSVATLTLKPAPSSVSVALVSSRFDTSGTAEDDGPVDTCNVTVDPFGAGTLPPGSCPTTTPAAASFDDTSFLEATKPAAPSTVTAESYGRPTTFGTSTDFGPFETLIRTTVPSSTVSPALGSWAVTVPSSLSELTSTTLAFRPASAIACTASSRPLPRTSGTGVFRFPSDTISVTALPLSMRSPAFGSCSLTRPSPTVSCGTRVTAGTSPSAMICSIAFKSRRPSTSGTATGLAEASSAEMRSKA